jgi:carbon starvation protein CstA
VGTTYLLQHARKRLYALCTGIPFIFVIATTFVAGVYSVRDWYHQIPTAPADQVHSLKLVTVIGSLLLVLTAVIVVAAVRCWAQMAFRPTGKLAAAAAEAELPAGSP